MGAISFKDTPTASKDTAWDGPAEVAAASIDDLKAMCAWVDSANPDIKSSYKLPHHKAGGDHAVVWRGVANAMARLSQTDIPASDKKAVYNHLAKHYAQFDETPPEMKSIVDETSYVEAVIEKADDGSFTAVASTNSVDRHGEIVDNNGWDLKNFKKNPVILWAHDHTEPAIGTAKKVWVDGEGKKAKLMIQPVLHDVTEKARAVKALVDKGIIKTLSVGFRPLDSPDGVTFSKNELLEVSMVNVPANADAMMMAYKSLKTEGIKDTTIKSIGIDTALVDKLVDMEQRINELESTVKVAPTDPAKRKIEKKLSMAKIIARATDKYLEASKDKPVDAKKTILVIKRATELLIVAEKDKLNG